MRRDGRSATQTLQMSYEGYTYEYPVCASHGDDLRRLAMGWTRYGEWFDEELQWLPVIGECCRCNWKATVRKHLGFQGEDFILDVCERHAEMLLDDVLIWQREGSLVGHELLRLVQRLTDASVRIEFPVVRVEEVQEPDPASLLPRGSEDWMLTVHAQERVTERGPQFGFTMRDVMLAALWPHHTETDRHEETRRYPGTVTHVRGDVRVVVNPNTHEIVTVKPNRHTQDHHDLKQGA